MEKMTSRERVRRAINFKEADRVPIDWGMVTVSGVTKTAYENLLKHLGLEEEPVMSDPVQRLVIPSEKVLDMMGVDTRVIWANPGEGYKLEYDEKRGFFDEFGTYYARTGEYCDSTGWPLANATSISDLKNFKLPDPTDKNRFKGLREKAKFMYENTDKALVGGNLASLYYMAWCLRGYENFMFDTAADPTFANYILDMLLEWHMAFMDCYIKEIGEYVDILWTGDDWGSQSGPLINPIEFRKSVVPRFKKLITFMKDRCDAKVAYHSCGSVFWALDDFREMGVDILQPLQANAVNMTDAKKLKESTYGKLILHGGTDNQGKFNGDTETLIQDTKMRLEAFKPGGGYIFGSGHNIQGDCPPENIVALFETGKKYGQYKG